MPKRTQSFRTWQLETLADPERSASYLNTALQDSLESFLIALGKVAQARQMAKVAKDAGVQRETLYRSLSKQGNPTLETLSSVLNAVGLELFVRSGAPDEKNLSGSAHTTRSHAQPAVPGTKIYRQRSSEKDSWGTNLNTQDSGYSSMTSNPMPFIPENSGSPEGALYAGSGNC